MIVYFDVPVVTLKMGLSRASVSREVSTTYLGFHHPSLGAQQTCLRAVVQIPRVTSEAHPPRTDPLVNLGQQVLRFIDCAPQVRERKCLTVYCYPVALKLISCVTGVRGIVVHMISILLTEMVRPNSPKTSTKTTIYHFNPHSDRDAVQASSAYSILPQIARRAHSSVITGPAFDGCS